MIRPVVKRGDPGLLVVCRAVTDVQSVQDVITDLWDTLTAIQGIYEFKRGSGIAAPQIGRSLRMNALEFGGQRYTLINPVISAHSDERVAIREGCLSFFDYRGKAFRYADITVSALDEHGKPFSISSNGDIDFASILQHELGHLDGVLYESVLAPGEELVYHPEIPAIP
jgi:peptide deformylase